MAKEKIYLASQEEVDAVKEAIAQVDKSVLALADNQIIKVVPDLEYGYINASGKEAQDSTPSTYMRTVDSFSVQDAIAENATVKTLTNATVFICYYNESNEFAVRETVSKNFLFNPTYSYFRLSFYRSVAQGGSDQDFFLSAFVWAHDGLDNRLKAIESNLTFPLSIDKVDFFDVKINNFFDGNYYEGISIAGSTTSNIRADAGYNSLAIIKAEPNTTYTAIVTDGGPEDNGYYYFKVAECYLQSFESASDFIGAEHSVLGNQSVGTYHKTITVTTGENATYLLVQASRSKKPFLQVVKGNQSDFTVYDYDSSVVGIPNKKISVYSKDEIDKKIANNTVSKNGEALTIRLGKARYSFERITKPSINIDTWRLFSGNLIKEDGSIFNMWTNSDAEGVVRVDGENDYLGGFHGSEKMTSVHIYIDGEEIDLSSDFPEKNFDCITCYVESDIYHNFESDLRDVVCFKRKKILVFSGNSFRVRNEFKALYDMSVWSRDCLFQCYYKENNEEVITAYNVNTDFHRYKLSDADYPSSSNKMNEANIITKYGVITFKSLATSGQDYSGMVAHGFVASQNRIKFYFDSIRDGRAYNITSGESITSDFEVKII